MRVWLMHRGELSNTIWGETDAQDFVVRMQSRDQ
jgi:hypothetical protein